MRDASMSGSSGLTINPLAPILAAFCTVSGKARDEMKNTFVLLSKTSVFSCSIRSKPFNPGRLVSTKSTSGNCSDKCLCMSAGCSQIIGDMLCRKRAILIRSHCRAFGSRIRMDGVSRFMVKQLLSCSGKPRMLSCWIL